MADGDSAEETEIQADADADEATETTDAGTSEALLDVESAEQREQGVEDLREKLAEQNERIEELEGLLLDLSTRVADGDGTGVCPDCHGPVVKRNPWFRSARVECVSCDRVFHEY